MHANVLNIDHYVIYFNYNRHMPVDGDLPYSS